MSKQTTITLTSEQYSEVRRLQKEEFLREFEAVAQVLGIDPNSDFVCIACGTPSAPRDGLKVVTYKTE